MGKKIFLLFTFLQIALFAGQQETGQITGKVVDAANQLPLIGVNIYIDILGAGAASNVDGYYNIKNIPVGTYSVRFSFVGFSAVTKTDIVITPDRTLYLNVEMHEELLELKDVTITAGYFNNVDNKTMSAISFSSEEVRRAPGSAGDISRILFSLPSVAKVNDQSNSLIVRGGTPVENSFYLDNIEIKNINHFPVQGSSEGPIGLLNVDFIDDVTFYSGGFSPMYGDKMSSVMDIQFRECNRNNFNGQLTMSFAGASAIAEGPLGKNGSYLMSVNKSYLDLIFKAIDESGTVPEYGDFQTKLTFDLDDKNKISFLELLSIDYINSKYQNAYDNGIYVYGEAKIITNTAGMNWRHIWGKSGYSNTSVGITYYSYDNEFFRTKTKNSLLDNLSKEISVNFRNVNYLKPGKFTSLDFGVESKYVSNKYDIKYGVYYDEFGNILDASTLDSKLNTLTASVFGNIKQVLFEKISLEAGLRVDYFDQTKDLLLSPRLALLYKASDLLTLRANYGIFYQNIPANILVQNSLFKDLKTPESQHLIVGLDYLLTEETKISVDLFNKQYSNFPVDPMQPTVFLFDETARKSLFLEHENLVDIGEAYSRGIELVVQKKFAKDFYGLISGSYSTARYKAMDDKWRDRLFDNRYNFAIEGGYKPGASWEVSMRWIYAGGRPYTPIDEAASLASGYETIRTDNINGERMPAYHSLNLRFDKRFHFDKSNLVVYLDIWNAYGRENIAGYYWDEVANKVGSYKGWGMLPVFGLEYEF